MISASIAHAQVYVAPPPPLLSIPDLIWNRHMMRSLGSTMAGDIAKCGHADKQAPAEVLVALGGMPAFTAQLTRDAAQVRKVAESTLVNLFGANGATIKITDNGLEL